MICAAQKIFITMVKSKQFHSIHVVKSRQIDGQFCKPRNAHQSSQYTHNNWNIPKSYHRTADLTKWTYPLSLSSNPHVNISPSYFLPNRQNQAFCHLKCRCTSILKCSKRKWFVHKQMVKEFFFHEKSPWPLVLFLFYLCLSSKSLL